jgi:hypothetical protein
MAKKIFRAKVRVPEQPRVRFFIKAPQEGRLGFLDVTDRVAQLVIEDVEDATGCCDLLRLDANGELVWKTRHPSVRETKWHVEFEFGLPEEKWLVYA